MKVMCAEIKSVCLGGKHLGSGGTSHCTSLVSSPWVAGAEGQAPGKENPPGL